MRSADTSRPIAIAVDQTDLIPDLTCTMIHDLTIIRLEQGEAAVRGSAAAMVTAGLAHLQALDGFDGARRALVREMRALRHRRTVRTVGRPGR